MTPLNTAAEVDCDAGREHDASCLFSAHEACLTGAPCLFIVGCEPDHVEPYEPELLTNAAFARLGEANKAALVADARSLLSELQQEVPAEDGCRLDGPNAEWQREMSTVGKWERIWSRELEDAVPMTGVATFLEVLERHVRRHGPMLDQAASDNPSLQPLAETYKGTLAMFGDLVAYVDKRARAASDLAGVDLSVIPTPATSGPRR
jgi:hypothetical protein